MASNIKSLLFVTINYLLLISLINSSVLRIQEVEGGQLVEAGEEGFTIDLIHRDSPLILSKPPTARRTSTMAGAGKSKYDLIKDAIQRSKSRLQQYLSSSGSSVGAAVIPAGGEYLMNISIGDPPVPFLGIADTGSDLTWTQCEPCRRCYNQSSPIFEPSKSSSYRRVGCNSPACNDLPPNFHGCSRADEDNVCLYRYFYGDNSSTVGELATETLSFFQGKANISNVVIGCGHNNQGTFESKGSGLIGLGGGALSLMGQTRQSPYFGGRFSYCLVPSFNNERYQGGGGGGGNSRISFGRDAVVSGNGTMSTPLVRNGPDTYYYLTLESISVGSGEEVNKAAKRQLRSTSTSSSNSSKVEVEEGNIIIDSGTTLTFLLEEFYGKLVWELKKAIGSDPVADPTGVLDLCYSNSLSSGEDGGVYDHPVMIPNLTFHFKGGADLKLTPSSTFFEVAEGVFCLAMLPSERQAILGNLLQTDYLVGYDLEAKTVSFKKTNCAACN